ncbi:MAG: right-handed parallel beta-helix repeat-containing protein, partial [Planctomycetota bacterium]
MSGRLGLALFLLMMTALVAPAAELFVAPDGSDDNVGTKARPFATIQRAQEAVRDVAGKEPVTVNLRAGTYYLTKPVVFGAEDSGAVNRIVVYKAYEKEKVRVSGGKRLSLQWQEHKGGIKKAKISRAIIESAAFDQFFVNGQRRHKARFPNRDPDAYVFDGVTSFDQLCRRASRWQKPHTGFMHAIHIHRWGSLHYRVTGFDRDKGKLQLEGGWQQNRTSDFRKDQVMVENIFEELDAPGEWYLDHDQAVLYFYPTPDIDLQTAVFEIGGLKELFLFQGSAGQPVKHISLEGIEFVHVGRTFLDKYEPLLRGDWAICRLAAVRISGAEDCSVRDCFFNQLGGNGVFLDGYNRRCEITDSRFHKLGESAVCAVGSYEASRSGAIGYDNNWPEDDFDVAPGPEGSAYPKNCRVRDCLIYNIGRVGKQTAGVFVSMAEDVTVSHCTIFSVPRSGITVNDGCWGGHVIEFNDIFDTVIETGDHGPFNSWGRDRYWKTRHHSEKPFHDPQDSTGQKLARKRALLDNHNTTIIRNNRFWHSGSHSWGIDLDDGSTNYHIYNNLTLGIIKATFSGTISLLSWKGAPRIAGSGPSRATSRCGTTICTGR